MEMNGGGLFCGREVELDSGWVASGGGGEDGSGGWCRWVVGGGDVDCVLLVLWEMVGSSQGIVRLVL